MLSRMKTKVEKKTLLSDDEDQYAKQKTLLKTKDALRQENNKMGGFYARWLKLLHNI